MSPPVAPQPSPARPLRLLQVLGYAGGGGQRFGLTGVERVVQALLEGLAAERFEHTVAYPRTGLLFEEYGRHARVLDLEPQRRYDAAYRDALAGAMQSGGIDLVVSHGLRYDFHATLACRTTRVPHVVVRAVALADEAISQPQKWLFERVDGWTLRACSGIVAVSEASKKRMIATQRVPESKITVIPNGVRLPHVSRDAAREARRGLGIEDGALVIGGAGQLIPRKAFDLLIEALGRLRDRHPNVVGVLLGEGPERARLESLALERGVRLVLPGFVADPRPAMAGFDVAVLPSQAEGMPLVVLEAMALGVACVATPAAGTVEVIEDERSGLLVPHADIASLAAALDRLLADPALRARLATAGRERVTSHFGLDTMLGRFDRYLHRMAGRSAS